MADQKSKLSSSQLSAVEGSSYISEQAPDFPNSMAEAVDCTREDVIRRGAHALYEARCGNNGTALDDWLQAEQALDQGAIMVADKA
ncbi:MAG: DUF2934 domain-containing protein [Comamonadaceae bacterium]|nr:MAG: DUF2934 domain-containing protein [Comamonadaceae bacterium]